MRDNSRPDVLPQQGVLRGLYNGDKIQILIAVLIFANFIISALQTWVAPSYAGVETEPHELDLFFFVSEAFFNGIFTLELIVNIYSNFFLAFWQDPWNVFDFAIVTISWISMLSNSK